MPSDKKKKGKYGARIFKMDQSIALVVQTIKSGQGYTDRYIVDTSSAERFVKLDDDAAIANAVRDALRGRF